MPKTAAAGPVVGLTIAELAHAYRSSAITPTEVVDRVLARIADRGDDGTWITILDRAELRLRAEELEAHPNPESLPLYGIPFGVKDSIDVSGVPTTLACPEYTYTATATAPVVAKLIEAGGIFIGKTNLDQFATGLNGTRTPYTLPRSVFGRNLISGGSSSGSALAVAAGEVPFAVATDTAGSGRVPPALNGVTGFKPSRGLISTVGLVPACRSLDCISLIAGGVADLAAVFDVVAGMDPDDPHARERQRDPRPVSMFRVGLPDIAELEFFGDEPMREAHLAARAGIERTFGSVVHAPFGPFLAAGELLYQGPWVAERLAEFGDFLADHPDGVLPVIRTILEGGSRYSAVDVFAAEHRLGELRVEVDRLWRQMDVLVLPAVGTTFTVDEVLADPIGANTALGHYTHFGNLLDLCAAVVPAGLTADGRPAALMVLGPALADDRVLAMAAALTGEALCDEALTPEIPDPVTLVVVGHHLSGQPRNVDLTDRGGMLLAVTRTAPRYRLLRAGTDNPVPVLVAVPSGGASIEVETWTVPSAACVPILAGSSESVCLGRVALADGTTEIGFVADASALTGDTTDITEFGGWRNYLADSQNADSQNEEVRMTNTPLVKPTADSSPPTPVVQAAPAPFPLPSGKVALVVIDMQRDFLLPGGFGETLGNDVSLLQKVVPPLADVLAAARSAGMLVIHTREGHLPDLSDCPPAKLRRGKPAQRIGDEGPHGRILIRGEYGHDIIDELAPIPGEIVIDKPGKGAFYATELQTVLETAGITHLVVTGVTTEVCVHTTVREANDRGYDALVLSDCVGSYFPEFQRIGLDMVSAQGGIFGWVADSRALLAALTEPAMAG